MNRRTFLGCSALAVPRNSFAESQFDVEAFDRKRVVSEADKILGKEPATPTAAKSPRSAGGLHDFFSEGDYWWPDPKNPEGPYVQRDGMTNPDNFVEHRKVLLRFSVEVPALTAAWKLTKQKRYAEHAAAHFRAWFVDAATKMNPNLQYAQAVKGRSTGRGTGVIDTIHLVEVARSVPFIAESGALSKADFKAVQQWFAEYNLWMTSSKNGMEERDAKNNHGTCWLMQVAAFAQLTGHKELLADCAHRFKTIIVPGQIGPDGSLPLELRRTKPYGYCLFNLEALATLCQIVGDDLWNFTTPDGRGMRKAIEYMFPYIADKKSWKLKPDVMYYEYWPMRQEALLFGGLAYKRQDYLDLWKKLPANSSVDEVVRNFFIRQPILWV